jgi:hypothetical protein
MEYYEPTWKELYYLFHTKKGGRGPRFSASDIIRIYENNMDPFEMEQVKDYFCRQCEDDLRDYPEQIPTPSPLPIMPPQTPLLPFIPVVPEILIEEAPEALPPPVDWPNFLLPVFPFIIWELLPIEFIDMLKDLTGVKEAEAALIEANEHIERLWNKIELYREYTGIKQAIQPGEPTYLWGEAVEKVDISDIATPATKKIIFYPQENIESEDSILYEHDTMPEEGGELNTSEVWDMEYWLELIEDEANELGLEYKFKGWIKTDVVTVILELEGQTYGFLLKDLDVLWDRLHNYQD